MHLSIKFSPEGYTISEVGFPPPQYIYLYTDVYKMANYIFGIKDNPTLWDIPIMMDFNLKVPSSDWGVKNRSLTQMKVIDLYGQYRIDVVILGARFTIEQGESKDKYITIANIIGDQEVILPIEEYTVNNDQVTELVLPNGNAIGVKYPSRDYYFTWSLTDGKDTHSHT